MSPAGAYAVALAGTGTAQDATQNERAVTFDADALRARGIDPALAAYFSQSARFSPGEQRVKLFVNDEPRGNVTARFDDNGQLCVDRALLERGGLAVPDALQGEAAPACYDYRQDVPQAEIALEPGENTVRLVVPQEALLPRGTALGVYATGGTAGVFNYNVLGMTNRGGGANSNFLYGDGEIGLNSGDWIVRSRHSYTSQDGNGKVNHLYTYAQKTFAEQKAMVQAGQINVSSGLLPVPPITGVQYKPDMALVPQQGGPSFDGIANSQSRVDVHQMGVLIYSTVVPAGPFTLSGLPLISASADLDVTLTENNNTQRRYTVPAASLRQSALPAPGLTVAAGKVRDVSDVGIDTPFLVTATKGWNMSERHTVTAGGLATTGYQAAAGGVSSMVSSNITTNLQAIVSNAQREGVRGVSASGSVNVKLAENWSAGATATLQTEGYRTVADTLTTPQSGMFTRFRSQYTASMTWQNGFLGGITGSYSRGSAFNGPTTQYATLSWNRMFGRATLSVNLEKDLGTTRAPTLQSSGQNGVRFYAMLSMPLGKASTQTYATNAGGDVRFGAGVSHTVNEALSYTARAETNPSGNGPNVNGSLSLTPRYTQAQLTYSQAGSNSSAYSAQVQGGAVVSGAGVTLSPYQVGDTFGIVQLGDVSGARISTPQGTVWTDIGGRAVIPTLMPYKQSRVELLTKSLPRNVDIDNGIEYVEAGRGSVNVVEFGVSKVRRLLLRVTSEGGTPLPAALPVLDADNQYITTSVGDGTVFLDDIPKSDIRVKFADNRTCRIEYTAPETPDLDRPFDAATGVCRF
ncbi:fimbria/pilus outer membrane usher protein [Ralstonia sp. SET104]|uniref:fimbria/pilus outer membrane usher protein n=1 Tax=Ralstonia sp. SET104 TaxID=2448774 RepID=UPI000FFAC27D|nr:fimbria/pilus outer membrane usher protein [Ralstonia sp. SET104]GCB06822.1 putative outer membrane usher protein YhcD [Ralstonia sp. SET104]